MKSMVKNYTHNVIRLRKGKPSISQVYWIIVILNKNKTSSQKQVEQLGFFRHGKKRLFSLNYERLAHFLNKGYKLKKSVKKFIYWYSIVNCKYYKKRLNQLKKKKLLKSIYRFMYKKKFYKKKKKFYQLKKRYI